MVLEEMAELLRNTFGQAILETAVNALHPSILAAADKWHDIALFLRDDPRFGLNMLRCLSGVDRFADQQTEVIYELMSMLPPADKDGYWTAGNQIAVRIRVPRDGGHIPTVSDVWPAANWHEREAFDLLGVTFDGHPDHRRILCPDDWVGHPLRKDYEYPREYHGIPGNPELAQQTTTPGSET